VGYDAWASERAVTLVVREGKGPPWINSPGNGCDTCSNFKGNFCCKSAMSSNHSQESLLPPNVCIYIFVFIVSFCHMEYSVLLEILVCWETGTISWANNLFLERTVVRKSYSYVNILCVYMQHYKLQGLVYYYQFHVLFVLEHNSAVVYRCRSCKVWGSYIETVTFGKHEELFMARIQILLLLWHSVSIHISLPATWDYKSTRLAGLVNRTA
jgi:hypothetical protein